MNFQMILEMTKLNKPFLTVTADVWQVTCMNSQVILQGRRLLKVLQTNATGVLCIMHL